MSSFSEEDRARLIQELHDKNPGIDVDGLLAGDLAGPATEGRPSVPIWEYPTYLQAHPDISIEYLSAMRVPLRLFSGEMTVMSIDELTNHGPIPTTFVLDPYDIIRLFELRHEAGALEWDDETRTLIETAPASVYVASVYGRWRQELEAKKREA